MAGNLHDYKRKPSTNRGEGYKAAVRGGNWSLDDYGHTRSGYEGKRAMGPIGGVSGTLHAREPSQPDARVGGQKQAEVIYT